MKKHSILLVEDNIEYATTLLQELGLFFDLDHSTNVTETRSFLEKNDPDLLLLDIDLGAESGFDLAIYLKSKLKKEIPIIYLTSKAGVSDRIMGYTLGADDFIQKSSDLIELQIRIKNVLDRHNKKQSTLLEKHGVYVDLLTRKAGIRIGETQQELNLSPTEFNILLYFLKHEGHALSRNQILDAVWGQKLNVSDRAIDTHIFSLRKKMESKASLIESVFGIGYRFSNAQSGSLEI